MVALQPASLQWWHWHTSHSWYRRHFTYVFREDLLNDRRFHLDSSRVHSIPDVLMLPVLSCAVRLCSTIPQTMNQLYSRRTRLPSSCWTLTSMVRMLMLAEQTDHLIVSRCWALLLEPQRTLAQ